MSRERDVTGDARSGRERLDAIGAREVPLAAQWSVRTREPRTLGMPTDANTWAPFGGGEALWLGPDDWLVIAEDARSVRPAAEALRGADSVVDVSANRVALELGGNARGLLEQGCSLDLDPRSWGPGACAQTLLARVPVVLQEREGATRLLVRPSYVNWLLDWLIGLGR
jgi:sarcosine oxidase subunit gamma